MPEDILTDLERRFVTPPGYGHLLRHLRGPGTVVVSGARGNGRRSAALMALKESGDDGAIRFRELPDDGDGGQFHLDPGTIEPGERLLLDLTAVSDQLLPSRIADLRAYRASVATREAYLAVVLAERQRHVAAELGTEAALVGRPDGGAVLRRHLRSFDIEPTGAELADDRLAPHLATDPMEHIAALAERVWQARQTISGGWAEWLTAALESGERLDAVARFVREHPDGRTRALLLAAAVFEHATPEVVALTAAKLLDVVGYPRPEGHRLDLPDLEEALAGTDAVIDSGQVRFRSVAHAAAVRTHFWRTFPDLRHDLRRWLDRCVVLGVLTAADRENAVRRFTTECLRVGHPADLCALAEQWARRSPHTVDRRLHAAVAALTDGLLHERHGQWFRRRLYQWSDNRRLPPSLATVVVGLCEGVIAPAHPSQALVRLQLLTRHARTEVVDQARDALGRLCGDGRFARRLLTRVHAELTGDRPRDVDFALFTDLADPVRLTSRDGTFPNVGERPVRTMLVDGWAAWLFRPYADTAVAVGRWLDAHAAEPGRDALLGVLAAATAGQVRRQAVLYTASRDWVAAAAPDERIDRLSTAALLQRACAMTRQQSAVPAAKGVPQ